MPFSDVLQLYVPTIFPIKAFEDFVAAVRSVTAGDSLARREFNGPSNLIGWRFRSCLEYKESFVASWRLYGANASFDAIYERERSLFGTFVCAQSCIEVAAYACYAAASDPRVLGLPFDEEIRKHRSSPGHLLATLRSTKPSIDLVTALSALLDSDEWKLIRDFRNTMAHRSNLPRVTYASTGELPESKALEFAGTWSSAALSENEHYFDALVDWLAKNLDSLLLGGTSLTHGK
jgi:hypothetical protein